MQEIAQLILRFVLFLIGSNDEIMYTKEQYLYTYIFKSEMERPRIHALTRFYLSVRTL